MRRYVDADTDAGKRDTDTDADLRLAQGDRAGQHRQHNRQIARFFFSGVNIGIQGDETFMKAVQVRAPNLARAV